MIVYRLSREKYKAILTGTGAAIRGGRWNVQGEEVVYTASSRALAMAEVLVHLPLRQLPSDYYMLVIYIPDSIPLHYVESSELPIGWQNFPYLKETQKVCGLHFHEKRCGVIRIPSAVVRGDYNYLINPKHRDFDKIKIVDEEKFPFDQRMIFDSKRASR